jgi:ferredoxin
MSSENFGLSRRKFMIVSSAALATPFLLNAAGGVPTARATEKTKTYEIGSTCIGCHHCFYNCPQSAIHWGQDKYEIDQSKCIHCGTCYETCNISAVSEK